MAEEADAEFDARPTQGQNQYEEDKKPCRSRLEEISLPCKRLVLNLWQDHAQRIFEPQRKKNVLRLVQELYSMSPEQAEIYFERKRNELRETLKRKKAQKQRAAACRKKAEKEDRERAYLVFFQFLIMGFWYARAKEIPPLVTARLRRLSDVILKQICELRNIDIPERPPKDEVEKHLVMLADWIAVSMEQIFFEAQIVANKEMDEIEEEVLKVMDLEGGRKEEDEGSKSILSKEVRVDEPELDKGEDEDYREAEGFTPE